MFTSCNADKENTNKPLFDLNGSRKKDFSLEAENSLAEEYMEIQAEFYTIVETDSLESARKLLASLVTRGKKFQSQMEKGSQTSNNNIIAIIMDSYGGDFSINPELTNKLLYFYRQDKEFAELYDEYTYVITLSQ